MYLIRLLAGIQTLSAAEGSEGSEEYGREKLFYLREYLDNHKMTFGSERTKGNEEHFIVNWRKGDPCYTVPEQLVELHHTDMCRSFKQQT